MDCYNRCGYQHLSILKKKKAIVLYPLSEHIPGAAWNKQSAGSGSDALGWDGAWEVYSGTVPSAPLPAV